MFVLWCKNCSRETENELCEMCGNKTEEDIPVEIYWCEDCKTPIIKPTNSIDKNICTICGKETRYMCSDLRPVFPEERLLIEVLIAKPFAYKDKTVWASNNRVYIDGVAKTITTNVYKKHPADEVLKILEQCQSENDYFVFNETVTRFVKANQNRLNFLFAEAKEFIINTVKNYPEENIVISFSGGKDSTVVADLTVRALSNPSLVHIFGDTTLEFPMTMEYAKRYRLDNPKAIFKTAKNKEQDFYKVCEDIGPPARMMRWR